MGVNVVETVSIILVLTLAILCLSIFAMVDHYRDKAAWSGTLEHKKIENYYYKGYNTNVYVFNIIKDNGERSICSVNKSIYQLFQSGDRLNRHKGKYIPSTINSKSLNQKN